MTTEQPAAAPLLTLIRRFRWIYFAPVLAFVALGAWAFASPIGAGPDDDYHLVSIWCSSGGSEDCQPGSDAGHREVAETFPQISCYAQVATRSADCQELVWAGWDDGTVEIDRGNFLGEYPPVYYAVMHVFAGSDIQVSALAMRLLNAALFVALGTALPAQLSDVLDPRKSPLNPYWDAGNQQPRRFAYGSFPLYLVRLTATTVSMIANPAVTAGQAFWSR